MSQNFEESPMSDSKMDISESATNSQESARVSPVVEILQESNRPINNISNATKHSITKLSHRTILSSTLSQNDNDPEIENRQQQNLSELTLANSHPLMSPSGTDSDSENGHHRLFNFPDVIPESEQPLRLANPPFINVIAKTLNVTSTTPSCTNFSNTGNLDEKLRQHKISVLRASSPDLLSSESEHELSQYQATVEPLNLSVALISNHLNRNNNSKSAKISLSLKRRKTPLSSDIVSDDISSLDSISNHSFEDDVEPNLASISPSSSFMDDFGYDHDDFDDDFCDIGTPTNIPADPIPTYTIDEERRDSRNWQKITLPDGRTREIDMKVIEPYKRVLSHGGYLKAGGHNAIVMFCACHLPDRSRADYHYVMDNLFLYVVKTLEQLVTEDYVLVYLHGGSSRRNVPPFPWLKNCYQLLDRKLRKRLRNLYLVHPTFWLKSIVWMLRPFVSSKFWRKLVYVRTLEELYSLVSVEKTAIPDKVKNYDSKHK